ncbi:MAG: YwiC-like family protein [Nitrospirae bacterium]|nr:YwiC-like family protein [Nitrospirota bacterium]
MKRYMLREYGSWGVMTLSFVAGLLGENGFDLNIPAAYIAISLYINSKQAFTLWLRSAADRAKSLTVFLIQVTTATLILLPLIKNDVGRLLPFAIFPLVYVFLLKFKGEHALLTEISGFTILSMSTLIAKYAVSGDIDTKLFITVAVFFTAGVFKVRIQLTRKKFYRELMVVYLAFASIVYHLLNVPIILLLPLIDNLIFSITLYKARLSVTGWTEVLKGMLFLLLMAFFY